MERGWRDMTPNCPRCGSTNTKFCYYNNYSLTQPRYFCKGCRRYWTKGGSLRNVPVGGGCRKSRRGNKLSLRVTSDHTTTPYPNVASTSCRSTMSSFGHVITNSNTVPSSSTSSSTSTIDLAVVYANFLKLKTPQERDERHQINLPIYNTNHHDQISTPQIPSISQANSMDLALASGLKDQEYLGEQGSHLFLLHHHNHYYNKQHDQSHMMMQNPSSSACDPDHVHGGQLRELLPPFPGDEEAAFLWEKNNNHDHHLVASSNDHNVESNALKSPMQDPLEEEAQLSSLFNIDGYWSPLDFSGYSDIQTPVDVPTTSCDIRQQQRP